MKFEDYQKDQSGMKEAMNRMICEHITRLNALLKNAEELIEPPEGFKLAIHMNKNNGCLIIVPEDENGKETP